MAEKIIDSRIQLKTDTTEKWDAVKVTFTPKKGEFIFYSDVKKFKVGDGSKKVGDLDFVNEGQIFKCTQNVTTFAEVTQALNEGKLPVLFDANNDWHTTGMFTRIRNDVYVFWSPMSGTVWDKSNGLSWKANYLYAAGYESTNGWVNTATYDGLDTRHVSTSVTSASKDTEVPSAKAVYTAINGIATATTSAKGLMSSTDKTKLDGIATGANKYVLPTANSTTLGGVKSGSSVTSTSGLTACPIIGGVPYYKEGTGSGGSSGAAGLKVEEFTNAWDSNNNFHQYGGLTAAAYETYTSADALLLNLENADSSMQKQITLYKIYYDSDQDGTGEDDYYFEATYNNLLYRLNLYYRSSYESYDWSFQKINSDTRPYHNARVVTAGGAVELRCDYDKGQAHFIQVQQTTGTSGWGWFVGGEFTVTNWPTNMSLFIQPDISHGADETYIRFDNTSSANNPKTYIIFSQEVPEYATETCVLADTQILTLDTATDTLVTKPVQDIKYGDTLAYWSPMKAGLIYNKVVMPPVVGDCTNYNRVYFSDGSTVDVFGTQFFWNCDKDLLVDYKKMTPSDRVCKSNGDIVNFDHYESLIAPTPVKHYTLMTDKGRYVANGIQTGDKVELFYPRLTHKENRQYWDALPEKTKKFFKKKHVEGMERRNWKYSTLYHETIGAYNDEKNQLDETIKEKQAYLDSTDYQVIKKMEGLLTDEEFAPVQATRQEARDAINVARDRIAELKATIKEKEAEVKATIYGKRKYTYHNAFEGKTRAVLDDEEPSAD